MSEESSLYRGFYVWAIATAVVLGFFLVFVLVGWPGGVNSCVFGSQNPNPPDSVLAPPPNNAPQAKKDAYAALTLNIQKTNSCYCECFNIVDAYRGAPGVRQKVNTWLNLYSIATSLVVAIWIYYARRDRATNQIGSSKWIPDLFIFAVLFLGLGSMWFHASIKEWGGVFDDLSMFVFVGFLIFYTVYRLWKNDIFFWIAYPATVAAATIVTEMLSLAHPGKTISLYMISGLVAVYVVFEFIIWGKDSAAAWYKNLGSHLFGSRVSWRWWAAVGSILVAAFFQMSSQTGAFLCNAKSPFQPHGMIWHPLAGTMAVFLYFYWRRDTKE